MLTYGTSLDALRLVSRRPPPHPAHDYTHRRLGKATRPSLACLGMHGLQTQKPQHVRVCARCGTSTEHAFGERQQHDIQAHDPAAPLWAPPGAVGGRPLAGTPAAPPSSVPAVPLASTGRLRRWGASLPSRATFSSTARMVPPSMDRPPAWLRALDACGLQAHQQGEVPRNLSLRLSRSPSPTLSRTSGAPRKPQAV